MCYATAIRVNKLNFRSYFILFRKPQDTLKRPIKEESINYHLILENQSKDFFMYYFTRP